MYKSPSNEELRQVEIALEQGRIAPRFQGILALFWGMIFAKLFILEYAMQVYEVPLNSTFYVWTLTLVMATVCTVAYVRLGRHRLKGKPVTGKMVRSIWMGVFTAILTATVAGMLLADFSPYLLPAIYALVLGVGFFSHSVLNGRTLFKALAAAWWLAALLLSSRDEVVTFAWFSGFLVVFQVLPSAYLHFWPEKRSTEAGSYSI